MKTKKRKLSLPKNSADPYLKEYLKYSYAERLMLLTKMREFVQQRTKGMDIDWNNPDERTRRLMDIPPEKKLEWLEDIRQTIVKTSSKKMLALRWKLRANPSRDGEFKIKR